MKQNYKNKLAHLTTKDIEDLMWLYYEGMDEKLLVTDYHIELPDQMPLYQTFPLAVDEINRRCPHCQVALLAFQLNRTTYKQEVFCGQCDCAVEALYDCRCEICTQAQDEVIQAIRQAFKGVKLGAGVGLYEAVGLDDYACAEERHALREKDEKLHWENIPVARLHECNSSLSFFDAAGMRFHLPAYLIAAVKSPYSGLVYSLCGLNDEKDSALKDYVLQQFSLLNKQQRAAVVLFLELCLTRLEYEYDASSIKTAIKEYWSSI